MAEWLKAHAWKACIRATVSWVRIPLPPPGFTKNPWESWLKTTLSADAIDLLAFQPLSRNFTR